MTCSAWGMTGWVMLLGLACGAGSAAADGPWFDAYDGSGVLESEEREVAPFTRLDVDCAFEIEIRIGEPQQLVLTFDDDLLEEIRTRVRRGTLYLDCDEELRVEECCRVAITVPRLEEVTTRGAADIHIDDFAGESFAYTLQGAGDLEIEGEVGALEIDLTGAGSIDARHLRAADVRVVLSGAGRARVHAEERFSGIVSGVGTIVYSGDPPRVRRRVTGIGGIDHRSSRDPHPADGIPLAVRQRTDYRKMWIGTLRRSVGVTRRPK